MVEGRSTDAFDDIALAADATVDSTTVSTTTAGRLLASKALASLQVTCSDGSPFRIWLRVDGTRVPGTILSSIPSGTLLRNVALSGVTNDAVPPGAHALAVGVDCTGPGSAASTTTFGSDNATVVVLGG